MFSFSDWDWSIVTFRSSTTVKSPLPGGGRKGLLNVFWSEVGRSTGGILSLDTRLIQGVINTQLLK